MCTRFAAAVEHPAVPGRRAEYKQCVRAGGAGCCRHFRARSQVYMPLKHYEQLAIFHMLFFVCIYSIHALPRCRPNDSG